MKRTVIILSLIFALAIALSASIPTLAATTSSSTTVIGSVGTVMEISATSIDFGSLTPTGETPTANTKAGTVTVRCNKAGWSLVATDVTPSSTQLGHMKSGSDYLTKVLSLTATGSTGTLDVSGVSLVTSGSKGSTSTALTYSQTPDWQDVAGSYSMTVQFTGTY